MVETDVSLSAHIVPLWLGAYALKTADGHVVAIFGPTIERWKKLEQVVGIPKEYTYR